MKTILILLTALLPMLTAIAAEPAAKATITKPNWWTDFSVTPFGALTRPNLTDRPVYGAGIDLGYNINKTVSLHLSNLGYETQDWGFGVGAGAELRFSKNVSIGADSRIRAWFKQEKDWLTRGFVSFKF